MKPEHSPWFAFYPNDFNAGTAHMTCEEVGIFVRLLNHQWMQRGVEAARVRIIPGSFAKPESLKTVLKKFQRRGNKLFNPRMEKTRVERQQFSAKQSAKAKLRWQCHGIAGGDAETMPQSQSQSQSQSIDLIEGKKNFAALRLANLIISNHGSWHYDNCKVDITKLKSSSLQTVIAPFVGKLLEKQILAAWAAAVFTAHGAKVDKLANDPTRYAVRCFQNLLKEKTNPTNP